MLPEVAARTISPVHVVVAGRQMTRRTHLEAVKRTPQMAHLCVRDVMTAPRTIGGADTVGAALDTLAGAPALAVVAADGTFSGYCGRDELMAAVARGLALDTPVQQAADDAVTPLSTDQSLVAAVTEVLRAGRDPLPVTDGDRHVVGMLGALEAMRALAAPRPP